MALILFISDSFWVCLLIGDSEGTDGNYDPALELVLGTLRDRVSAGSWERWKCLEFLREKNKECWGWGYGSASKRACNASLRTWGQLFRSHIKCQLWLRGSVTPVLGVGVKKNCWDLLVTSLSLGSVRDPVSGEWMEWMKEMKIDGAEHLTSSSGLSARVMHRYTHPHIPECLHTHTPTPAAHTNIQGLHLQLRIVYLILC